MFKLGDFYKKWRCYDYIRSAPNFVPVSLNHSLLDFVYEVQKPEYFLLKRVMFIDSIMHVPPGIHSFTQTFK
jgi:hypothetical protein